MGTVPWTPFSAALICIATGSGLTAFRSLPAFLPPLVFPVSPKVLLALQSLSQRQLLKVHKLKHMLKTANKDYSNKMYWTVLPKEMKILLEHMHTNSLTQLFIYSVNIYAMVCTPLFFRQPPLRKDLLPQLWSVPPADSPHWWHHIKSSFGWRKLLPLRSHLLPRGVPIQGQIQVRLQRPSPLKSFRECEGSSRLQNSPPAQVHIHWDCTEAWLLPLLHPAPFPS